MRGSHCGRPRTAARFSRRRRSRIGNEPEIKMERNRRSCPREIRAIPSTTTLFLHFQFSFHTRQSKRPVPRVLIGSGMPSKCFRIILSIPGIKRCFRKVFLPCSCPACFRQNAGFQAKKSPRVCEKNVFGIISNYCKKWIKNREITESIGSPLGIFHIRSF